MSGKEREGEGSYRNVKGGDHVQGRSKYGAHDFDRRLVQAIVGRQDLTVEKGELLKEKPKWSMFPA